MKNSLLKLLLISYSFLFTAVAFATNNDPIANNEVPETDEGSISQGLIWLFLAGIAFAVYYFSTQKSTAKN